MACLIYRNLNILNFILRRKRILKYAVNFINDEVLNLSNKKETYIKYPGGKWDFETLNSLTLKKL